jgi:DNA repair exonuclease SbcCD ATPase subunit
MIIFKTITAKNFLSYGNSPTTWYLDKHPSTLIVGKNGHGKSVLLDLVCFSIFGKPYRNVNKPQLINSINGKNCLTEMELTVDGVPYKIVRGMKPNIFEIYKEGKMLDQDAAMRDMQEYLEQTILKLNYKTFCQVVILGSASFTPFMQLQAYQRREVVEDVLDIAIFSKMNSVLKDRIASNKEETRIIDVRVDSSKKEAASQKKIIDLIEKNLTSRIAEIEAETEDLNQQQRDLDTSIVKLKQYLDSMETSDIADLRDQRDSLSDSIEDAKHSISQIKSKLSKFDKIVECPTCLQGVGHDHKESIHLLFSTEQSQLQDLIDEKTPVLAEVISKIQKHDTEVDAVSNKLESKKQERKSVAAKIVEKEKQIQKLQEDTGDLTTEKTKLKEIAKEALVHINRKNELVEEKQLQEVSQVLLKDNGIKTAIIKEYLPVLNKLINKYLQSFDFFVNFNLDESFSEKIKSRGRDEFSYANFSEGEKRKIDLAILLSFRQIAAMKNSAKVNLLLFDEIADSSFDLDARAKFNELLMEMSGSNVFVISHTDTSPDAYTAAIKVEKKGDFSQYTYV